MFRTTAYSPLGVPLIHSTGPPEAVPTTFATVLCANLHGYDELAAALQPTQVVSLLEEYFALLTDAILEFGGQILHLADADLMAGFGLGDCRHSQILESMAAARAIQRRFDATRRSWQERWTVDTSVGIGIHRGEFAIAMFGSEPQGTLVIIGDTANLASALCKRARAGEILMSSAVHGPHAQASGRQAGAGDDLLSLTQVKLPGRSSALDLWCVPVRERLRMGLDLPQLVRPRDP